jgi:alkaline phosphatase D
MAGVRRRDALLGAAALSVAAPLAAQARTVSDPHPALATRLGRIAFGSCAEQNKPQPIWDAVLAAKPDLFVFLGDNVYIDSGNPADYAKAYAALAAKPGFQKLRATTPILAIWDDHDFGDNDQDGSWPLKDHSRQVFFDFWGEAADSPRRNRDGIYGAYVFGPVGEQVQLILPDLRYNKTPNRKLDLGRQSYKRWSDAKAKAGLPVPGPYARDPDPAATQLGAAQWQWLEAQLRAPAQVRVLCSSLQVVADFPGWEEWVNYPHDHGRLIDTVRRTGAQGFFCISGDTHYGEISRLDTNVPYPLWDFTSSGLTEVWPVTPPNALRRGSVVREPNFGLIEIDWAASPVRVTVSICDGQGVPKLSQQLSLAQLRA